MLVLLVTPLVCPKNELADVLMAVAVEFSRFMIEALEIEMHREEYESLPDGKL